MKKKQGTACRPLATRVVVCPRLLNTEISGNLPDQ